MTGAGGATDAGATSGSGGEGPATGTGGAAGAGAGGSVVTGTGGSVITGTGGSVVTGTGGSVITGAGGSVVTGTGGSVITGAGGTSPVVVGCADGTREAFTDLRAFPSIAGCAGGWSTPGVVTLGSLVPTCGRAAGNGGTLPNGNGCTIEDLCAAGWHVCMGANELDDLGVSCNNAGLPPATGAAGPLLFATRQRGRTGTTCTANDAIGVNNVHGCGNFGLAEDPNCSPLDRQFSHTECDMAPPWFCDDPASQTTEGLVVIKSGPAGGGVLCCH